MDDKTIAAYRVTLEKRRAELTEQSSKSAESRAPVTLDQQSVGRVSRVDALQQQAMAEAHDRQRQMEITQISQALKRIIGGDFGYCLDCGEEIAAGRLAVNPGVALCVRCASSSK